jgi:hypothetical protein
LSSAPGVNSFIETAELTAAVAIAAADATPPFCILSRMLVVVVVVVGVVVVVVELVGMLEDVLADRSVFLSTEKGLRAKLTRIWFVLYSVNACVVIKTLNMMSRNILKCAQSVLEAKKERANIRMGGCPFHDPQILSSISAILLGAGAWCYRTLVTSMRFPKLNSAAGDGHGFFAPITRTVVSLASRATKRALQASS